MLVVFDSTMMLLFLRPDTVSIPSDGNSGHKVSYVKERIDLLIEDIKRKKNTIIIPTPVLSEVLIGYDLGEHQKILSLINQSSVFRIAPFGERAAAELAIMMRKSKEVGDKRGGIKGEWGKIKVDWQIIAIAKVEGATAIYSDDEHISKRCSVDKSLSLDVINLASLPLPLQGKLDL